ncbi:MAG: hypothetical protein KatS3mg021_1808 [Fimbriimonadales bacterium]|nr:MAG: hypothetical protein KatS3mg021_1808 [Fimbriimonadales bacterium]
MRTRLPFVTGGLLLTHTLATFWCIRHPEVVEAWGFTPANPQWINLLTSLFAHASYIHWLKNALFLTLFGWYVERALDGWRFLALYFISGVLAALTHWAMVGIFQPTLYDDSLVGASGAISGLVGYFALRYYRRRVRLAWSAVHQWGWGIPMWVAVLLWVLWQGDRGNSGRGERKPHRDWLLGASGRVCDGADSGGAVGRRGRGRARISPPAGDGKFATGCRRRRPALAPAPAESTCPASGGVAAGGRGMGAAGGL